MQEDNAAAKSDRENPKAKQGVKAWVSDHEMTFDTLKALQLAGWLLFSMCLSFLSFRCLLLFFLHFNIQNVLSFLFYHCWQVSSTPPLPWHSSLNFSEL